MKKENYFLLFSNCIVINGHKNSIIYDLQMCTYRFIPVALGQIITRAKNTRIKDILGLYREKHHNDIVKSFEQLVKESLGFYTDDPTQFPDLDLYWDHPAIITNAIINWSSDSILPLKKTCDFIEKVGCDAIQIIVPQDLGKVEQILEAFKKARVKSIELLTNYISKEQVKELLNLCKRHIRVTLLQFFKSPIYKEVKGKLNLSIIYSDSPLDASEFFKFKAEQWPLVINIPFFTESQKHHTYFNRKIYISATGDIKNAPECEDVIGNINRNSIPALIKAIKNESNQKYWHVSKDICDVCNNCELRYMCMDNRIPYQRKDGGWYHKEECNYNPYIGKWKGEEGYKSLSECGIISDEKWFFLDYVKVEQILLSNQREGL